MKEVEKAVIGMGEYFAYSHLEVPSSKWFSMSSDQRKRHLKKVTDVSSVLFEDNPSSSSYSLESSTSTKSLLYPVGSLL